MVEKKLNFNQPILSVRRYSQKVDERKIQNAFPVIPQLRPHRSELNSGPVRHPGAVPFQWERAPGQPKEQIKHQTQNRYPSSSDNNIEAGDCDEAIVDELDSLSRTESFLSSCSLSSLPGMDDLDAASSRSFSTDPQTREFTTDDFLPPPKSKSAVQEQSEEVKKEVVNQDKPALWYRPTFAKSCSHYNDKEEREESDHDRDQHENLIAVCCLLPRSCLKSSVCIVNPVSTMSVRTRLAMFPCMQSGSSSADSLSETENEDTVKPDVKTQTDGVKENKTSLVKEIARLGSCNALTYSDWPLSFNEEKELVGVHEDMKRASIEGFGSRKKSFKTLQELLADEDRRKELDSRSCMEKNVYLDSRSCMEKNVYVDKVDNTRSCEDNNVTNTMRTGQMHILDSSDLEDFKKLKTVLEAKLLSNAHKSGDFNIMSNGGDEDLYLDSTGTENMEVAEKKATKNVEKQLSRETTLRNSHEKYPKFPAPPPLPRSPSDSWLFRTLPSMSTKKASNPSFISRCSSKS